MCMGSGFPSFSALLELLGVREASTNESDKPTKDVECSRNDRRKDTPAGFQLATKAIILQKTM